MLEGKNASEKLHYLFESLGNGMHVVANSILHDSHMAEDVVQEVFIRIFREEIMEKLDAMGEAEARAYIFMAVRNVSFNYYTKRKREGAVTFPDYNEEAVNSIPVEDCADIVFREMMEDELFKIVSNMPERYSYVLISRYKYELSDKQIADVCEISEAAVRKRLERGRKMLRERLEQRHYLDD